MTVPPGLRHHDIDAFLDRHGAWLNERIARMETRDTARIADGGSIPLRGVFPPYRTYRQGCVA